MKGIYTYKGYVIQRGDYLYGNDNRIDRWYIQEKDSPVVDRRGDGFRTVREAKEFIAVDAKYETAIHF